MRMLVIMIMLIMNYDLRFVICMTIVMRMLIIITTLIMRIVLITGVMTVIHMIYYFCFLIGEL